MTTTAPRPFAGPNPAGRTPATTPRLHPFAGPNLFVGPNLPTALVTCATVLGGVTFDSAPGRWTRTLHRSSTGQQFEVPLSHEYLPADLTRFAGSGVWSSIGASPDGRTITLTGADTADTPMTLTFARH